MDKMSFKKPFSSELFNGHDPKARQKVLEIFKESTNLRIQQPEDKYSADLDVYKGEVFIGRLELEIKNNWDGQIFPFKDVQFLERKNKYNNKTVWVLFNKDLSRHLTIPIREVVKCQKREIVNKFSNGQKESFYVVPISIVNLDGLVTMIKNENGR